MENLNAEQIKKALECCTVGIGTECEKCPYMLTKFCNDTLKKDVLTYIKELTEENERLQKALNTDITFVRISRGSGKTAHLREVVRIKADVIRADTVRKMHHKIWLEFSDCTEEETVSVGSFRASVDQIAKEMLEGENNGS